MKGFKRFCKIVGEIEKQVGGNPEKEETLNRLYAKHDEHTKKIEAGEQVDANTYKIFEAALHCAIEDYTFDRAVQIGYAAALKMHSLVKI